MNLGQLRDHICTYLSESYWNLIIVTHTQLCITNEQRFLFVSQHWFLFFLKKNAADRNLNSRPESHEEEGGIYFILKKQNSRKWKKKLKEKTINEEEDDDANKTGERSIIFLLVFFFLLFSCCYSVLVVVVVSFPSLPARPSSDGKEGMDRVTLGLRQWSDERRFSPFLISLLLSCPDVLHNNTKGVRFIFSF